MRNLLLTIIDGDRNNAGPKAKEDIITILSHQGITSKKVIMNFKSPLQKLWYAYVYFPYFFARQKGKVDKLYFQYPAYSYFMMNKIITSLKKRMPATKLFFIVHDVESLRLTLDDNSKKIETNLLNEADGLIIHNNKMKRYLLDKGVTTKMVNLGIFDYLNSSDARVDRKFSKSVCYAGNLKKSKFLNHLTFKNITLDVYGVNPAKNYGEGVEYKGVFSPEELPKQLNESFGLVWDGDSPETCSGIFGNYLRYNDPHKASLYISSCIPVIIWKDAALASFIENNNLGFCISSLNDMEEKIEQLSYSQYSKMIQSVSVMSKKMRNGQNILSAINKFN